MIFPKKSLSQNFLHDQKIIKTIIDVMNIQNNDCVLEIGPGKGALTKELVQTDAQIIAVEIDKDLIPLLQKLEQKYANFKLYHADFRSFDMNEKIPMKLPIKLVSNLPYHLTGVFLRKICLMHRSLISATLMVQKEVAERMCATSGKKYGFLSVFTQFFASIRYLTTVPNASFYPRPNVDSAVVQLTFKIPQLTTPDPFFAFVQKCFHGKRKQLVNCLKPSFNPLTIRKGLSQLNLKEDIRAEMLSVNEFLNLYYFLENNRVIQ